jgi:MFS family permease
MAENGLTPEPSPPQAAAQTPAPAALPAPEVPAAPGARVALAALLFVNLFNYIDRQVLAANVTPIEQRFLPVGGRGNKERLGWLALAFMVSYLAFAPLFGWLATRMPRWKIVGAGVILWSLASGASGLADSFVMLLATRCLVGVGEAAYGPVAPDIISDLFPAKQRGRVLSWFYVAIPIGGALGYALGGAAGYPASFFLVVPPGVLLGLWCFLLPEPRRGQTDLTRPVRPVRPRDYLLLLRTPSYVLNTLGMAALTFATGGIAHWMPDYISTFRHGDPDVTLDLSVGRVRLSGLAGTNVLVGLIVIVSGLTATLLGGWAGDALRPRWPGSYFLVSGAAMLLGFPLFLAMLYVPFPYAWGLIFLACFCLFFNTGPSSAILANVTHPALRAQAFAINIFVIHLLGDAVSPTVIGRIADDFATDGRADMHAGFLAVSFLILLGGLLWLWGARYLARDTERAPRLLD